MSLTESAGICLLCGDTDHHFLVTGYDRMHARAEDYPYVRCVSCGLVSIDPLPTAEEILGFYPDDYHSRIDSWERNLDRPVNRLAIKYFYGVDSVARSRWLRIMFRMLSRRILKGLREPHGVNRILDVGCGAGAHLDVYRRLGWRARGIEISARACAACRQRGLEVHEGTVFDAPFGPEFDVVLLSHVIEHVRDPVTVLMRAAEFLAPGGQLMVITPNARALGFALYRSCWYPLDAPRHVFLFSPQTIRLLAEKAGLVIRKMATQSDPRMFCESRHYAVTQGPVLPEGLDRRRALLEDSSRRKQRNRLYRELLAPLAFFAARMGRGDLIEAEIGPCR